MLTILKNCESIDTIHFISDSPSTQYRSVKNLFLMKKLIHQQYQFAYATWNFTAASHGKGPADGVGALVKSIADRMVNLVIDIPSATALFDALSGKIAVDMFMISENDIIELEKVASIEEKNNALKIPGLMKVHHVRSSAAAPYMEHRVMEHRVLSCFCQSSCSCLEPVRFWETTSRVAKRIPVTGRVAPKVKKTSIMKVSSVIVKPRPLTSRPALPCQPTWLVRYKAEGTL